MPRIRRGDKRIRGSNGGRTRNADCCCGVTLTCAEWNDATTKAGVEFNYEITGLTIGTTTGCACASVPLSGIATYAGCAGEPTSWCQITLLGCNDSLGNEMCVRFAVRISCIGTTINIFCIFYETTCVSPSGLDTEDWEVVYSDSMPAADFISGTAFDIPYASNFVGATSKCKPTGMTTSTLSLSFSA